MMQFQYVWEILYLTGWDIPTDGGHSQTAMFDSPSLKHALYESFKYQSNPPEKSWNRWSRMVLCYSLLMFPQCLFQLEASKNILRALPMISRGRHQISHLCIAFTWGMLGRTLGQPRKLASVAQSTITCYNYLGDFP